MGPRTTYRYPPDYSSVAQFTCRRYGHDWLPDHGQDLCQVCGTVRTQPPELEWTCTCCTGEHQEPSDDEIATAIKELGEWTGESK